MQHAATRSPSLSGEPSGALRTVPATSLPGTNGSGGLIWYSPRVWSTSGNETPGGVHVDHDAAPRRERMRRLGLGEIRLGQGRLGAREVDDLNRAHGAGTYLSSPIEAAPEMHHGVGAPGTPRLVVGRATEARERVPDADVLGRNTSGSPSARMAT